MDKYRQGTPRNKVDLPKTFWVIVVSALLILASMVFQLVRLLDQLEPRDGTPVEDEGGVRLTHDSMAITYTYDGESIRYYVMTDPDTGAQYIVTDHGGITPRLGIVPSGNQGEQE